MTRLRIPLALTLMACTALASAGCGGVSDQNTATAGEGGSRTRLTLVAYSTPKEAYEAVIPAFQRTQAGRGVTFDQSYGASGDQSRAVASGLPADVVALSLAPDVDKLVEPGKVAEDWTNTPTQGFVTNSVVVLAVRKGNPKDIRTWDDLVKPGIEVLTPNPFTSGGARWNLMAAYGAQIKAGRSEAEALDYLRKLLEHTPVQDKSAREALQTFAGGKGDVLIAYENEALTAQAKGIELEYVVPDATILIQNPIALVEDSEHPEQAQAFIDFATSDAGQKVFAEKGYRPVERELVDTARFPIPKQLFRIDEFGGWSEVNKEFFDPATGSVAKIEKDLGVSTAK